MTIKKTVKWAAPVLFKPDLDEQVERAMKRKDIKKAFLDYEGDPKNFKESLRSYIEKENLRSYRLIKFSNFMDSFNKVTVPIDSALDYFNIMGGLGYAAKGLKTLAAAPGYLAYDLYYLGKTGDVSGTLKNIGYEGISWLSLGSIPHLMNYYTKQTEKYAVKKGSEGFLKSLESKTISFEEEKKKKESLEDLAKAA